MNKFAKRLKEVRKECGMKRVDLANRLNVSVRLISYWENGERECSFDTLLELAEIFSVSTDYLLGRAEY
ncbi:MAG: helix-turn-helix transcriptional regulator [Clostridia bacterium]|nr:helix-turn-helix transcriptional regulator [Clostridia bacterium]